MVVYTLLKGIGYYDLSVLSMSVMGFQTNKKVWMGCVGGVSSIQVYFGIWNFFNFAKPLSQKIHITFLQVQITGSACVLRSTFILN